MDLYELSDMLTKNSINGGELSEEQRLVADNCIMELLAISNEFKIRFSDAKKPKIKLKNIEQDLKTTIIAVEDLINRLSNPPSEFLSLLQKMTNEFDLALNSDYDFKESVGDRDVERPIFKHKMLETWINSRAPSWFKIKCSTTNAKGENIGYDSKNPKNNRIYELEQFLEWLKTIKIDLNSLKYIRARQGSITIEVPLDQKEWLVVKVAKCVLNSGGEKKHVIPITRVIGKWANPDFEISDRRTRFI